MRTGLNLLITGCLIWLSTLAFPGAIIISGWASFIVATLLFFVVVIVISGLCILFLTPVLHRNAPVLKMATVAFVITVVVGALAFFFLCTALDGFTVNSFWIALFVSFVASLLTFTTEIKFA